MGRDVHRAGSDGFFAWYTRRVTEADVGQHPDTVSPRCKFFLLALAPKVDEAVKPNGSRTV